MPTRSTPSFQDVQKTKAEYINASYESLENRKVSELKKIAKSLNINRLVYNKREIFLSRAKKAEILSAIWGVLEEYRASVLVQDHKTVLAVDSGTQDFKTLLAKIYTQLEKYAFNCQVSTWENRWSILAGEASALGASLATKIRQMPHHQTGFQRSDNAHIHDLREARQIIKQMIDQSKGAKEALLEAYPYFEAGAKNSFQLEGVYARKKRQSAEAEIKTRSTQAIKVDIQPLLKWAELTLTSISSSSPKTYWLKVSIALAIATGRRQNEIHFHTTNFRKINEGWVWFEGQSKGKQFSQKFFDTYPEFAIPVLVPADLVIKGFEYLHSLGKIIKDDRRKVNKNYSKVLGLQLKKLKLELNLPETLTYHELRDLYVLANLKTKDSAIPEALEVLPMVNSREADWSCYILGEGRTVYQDGGGKPQYGLQKNLAFLRYWDKYELA